MIAWGKEKLKIINFGKKFEIYSILFLQESFFFRVLKQRQINLENL